MINFRKKIGIHFSFNALLYCPIFAQQFMFKNLIKNHVLQLL